MALETDRMNQEISWGPALVLCGPSRVPASLKLFSLWSETLMIFFSTFTCFFLRMWLEIHPPGSDGGILYVRTSSTVPLSFQTKHLRAILTRRSAEFLSPFSSSEVNGCGFCGRQVFYTHTRHPALNTSVSLKAWKRRWMLWGQSRAFHHMFLCSQVQQKRWLL